MNENVIHDLSELRSQFSIFDENEEHFYNSLSVAIKAVKTVHDMENAKEYGTKMDRLISEQAIVDVLSKGYYDKNLQSAKDDPCVIDAMIDWAIRQIKVIQPAEPNIGHCKDCKWWKDSDGTYRRGIGAESQCPINRKEVYEGNGYCFMFESQESEGRDDTRTVNRDSREV